MDFKDVVHKRRAVNFFDHEKPVSGDLLKEMVEMAANVPSSFNLQPWSLRIVQYLYGRGTSIPRILRDHH